jgi:hypothetical protein
MQIEADRSTEKGVDHIDLILPLYLHCMHIPWKKYETNHL